MTINLVGLPAVFTPLDANRGDLSHLALGSSQPLLCIACSRCAILSPIKAPRSSSSTSHLFPQRHPPSPLPCFFRPRCEKKCSSTNLFSWLPASLFSFAFSPSPRLVGSIAASYVSASGLPHHPPKRKTRHLACCTPNGAPITNVHRLPFPPQVILRSRPLSKFFPKTLCLSENVIVLVPSMRRVREFPELVPRSLSLALRRRPSVHSLLRLRPHA